MITEQLFQFPDEEKKLAISVGEMRSREDHKAIKAIMVKRYKRAHRAVCQNLITSYRERFLLQYRSGLN
jgi:hypothetical protein